MLFVPADETHKIEPLHRHRVRVVNPKGGKPWPQVYPDKRSVDWEDYIAESVELQLRATPTEGSGPDFILPLADMRILLNLRFNLLKPASYPARVQWNLKKPDIDNYGKCVIDGLVKARLIKDDGLITDLSVQKRYVEPGHPYGVEIDLTALPCETV